MGLNFDPYFQELFLIFFAVQKGVPNSSTFISKKNKMRFSLSTGGLLFASCFVIFSCKSKQKSTNVNSPSKMDHAASSKVNVLDSLLHAHPNEFKTILDHANDYRVQIIYTQINRNQYNVPSFEDYSFRLNSSEYFYPASTVKFPTAVLALQKLRELNQPGLDRFSTMITEGGYSGMLPVYNDPSSPDGKPSINHYIKKILLTSDNDAFNRLYEFLGSEYINSELHKRGFKSAQIIHRLERSLTEDENRHSNPVNFFDLATGQTIYSKPILFNQQSYPQRNDRLGKGYMKNDQLVDGPMDFSKKNRIALDDLHNVLRSIMFPEAVASQHCFHLEKDDYQFLRNYMSMYPAESGISGYDSSAYWDSYCKFLYWGSEKGKLPKTLRIFNKVGDAYGFLLDVAYVADFDKNIEFMVSAVIYCNNDGILNDSKYDYDTIGFPFFKNLGRVIYQYELTRKRSFPPDLSAFKFSYEK